MRASVAGVAAICALTLAACGTGTVGEVGGDVETDRKKLALIPGIQSEPFYVSMQCAAEDEARKLGYSLQTAAPEKFAAEEQTEKVNGVANQSPAPAGVLIAPTSDTAMKGPMQDMKDSGIKVVEVDTALKDTSVAQSTITSDNVQGGQMAARTLADLVGGKKGSVLVLDTVAGTSTTAARARGFADELRKYPNLSMLNVEFTDDDPAVAAQKVTGTLSGRSDLVGVFATNLNTGQGAANALSNAGRAGDVKLVGFDASPNEVTALRAGKFQALIAQEPGEIGREGVRQVDAAINGRKVTRNISAGLVAITRENMDAKKEFFYKDQC